MSTHNICTHREIRKILCRYPLLSVAMKNVDIFQWVKYVYLHLDCHDIMSIG